MLYDLSFGTINILQGNIAEIVVDEGTVITLEMCEESDLFFIEHFTGPFTVLLNKINNFTYTYEAKLLIGSLEHLHAIAVVNYSKTGRNQTQNLVNKRQLDVWNIKEFSGFNSGRAKGLRWLENQLAIPCS